MKIGHLIWNMRVGGSETMLVDILNRQVQRDDVTLFIINADNDQQMLDKLDPWVKVVYLNRKEGSKNPWYILRINHILRKAKLDVLHMHVSNLPKIIIGDAAKIKLITLHTIGLRFSPKSQRKLDAMIAISQSTKEDQKGLTEVPIEVSINGIDIAAIPHLRRARTNLDEKFNIVMVGRLVSQIKGQDILIKAVAGLHNQGYNQVHVNLIGEGESRLELEQLAKDLGIADYVHFHGAKDRDFIYSFLSQNDLMVHPARNEGFGLTVAEGMVANLPILVSDKGGPYEVIDNGRLGFYFKDSDSEDCTNKIKFIIDNYKSAYEIAKLGRSYARDHYSIDRQVKEYREIYQKYLDIKNNK